MQIQKIPISNAYFLNKAEISEAFLLRLTCQDGFFVSLFTTGASIRQIGFPSRKAHLQNLALSFLQESTYASNPLYAGATLAPTAGRISLGHLPVGDHLYTLSRNENGTHSLHGGFDNASFRNWDVREASVTSSGDAQVVFSCILPDGLDGFPGNRRITVTYTLTEAHQLTIDYKAVSDQDTYFNISNHSYFNLSGDFSRPATDHLLQIRADRYICNAPDFIPEGIAEATHTPFDFRQPVSLHEQLQKYPEDIQIQRNQGYNHGFILNHTCPRNRQSDYNESSPFYAVPDSSSPDPLHSDSPDLTCSLPDGSVTMSVCSDAPCMVLYSGGYIDDSQQLINGQHSVPSCALAFEFQDYPDAPGGHGFPYQITPADVTWTRNICYNFIIH